MIHPLTTIKYINLTTQKEEDTTLEKFWKIMSTHRSDRIMIQENYGWTDVQDMAMCKLNPDDAWMAVTTRDGHCVYVSKNGVIPIWDPEVTKPGFHGRVLYGYQLVKAAELMPGYMLRILPGRTDWQFKEIASVSDTTDGDPYKEGYQLVTVSGFFAGNGIQLNGCKYHDSDMHWD